MTGKGDALGRTLMIQMRLPRWLSGVACFAGLSLALFDEPAAEAYFVGTDGSDSNPGTETRPFRQVRQALNFVQAGDTVLVADGTYLGFDVFGKTGTAAAPITLRAVGTNAVIIPTSDRGDNRDTIHLSDCAYVVVDGFRSFGANRAAMRVQGGHHVTIRDCVLGRNTTWGLFTGFSEHLLIENNECFASTNEHGIYVSNSADNPILRGNRCHGNGGSGIQLNADASIQPGDGIMTNALIEGNVIYDNGRRGGGAINLDGLQHSIVRNNLLFNNHASGIIFFAIDGKDGPRGNQVYHNTIEMPSDGRWALNFLQTTGTNIVRNNILLTRHTFRGSLRFGTPTDAANTDSDYNLLTRITPDDEQVILLAEWQALGKEPHSVSASLAEVFADANLGNYRLPNNSPAVDIGQAIPDLNLDLEGNPRPAGAAPDLGCYENSPPRLGLVSVAHQYSRVQLTGGVGRTVRLDSRDGSSSWTLGSAILRSNRPVEFIDTALASRQRFFSAHISP